MASRRGGRLKWALLNIMLFTATIASAQEIHHIDEKHDYNHFDTIPDDVIHIINDKLNDEPNNSSSTNPVKDLEAFSRAFTRPGKLMEHIWKSKVLNELESDEAWRLGIFGNFSRSQITTHANEETDSWRRIYKCLHSPVPSIQLKHWWPEIKRLGQSPLSNATYRPYIKPNGALAMKFLLDVEYYPNASSILPPKGIITANKQLRGSFSANNMILTREEESRILGKLERATLEPLRYELSILFPTFQFSLSHFAHIAYRAALAGYCQEKVDPFRSILNFLTDSRRNPKTYTPSFPQILRTANEALKQFTKTVRMLNRHQTNKPLLKVVYSIVFTSQTIMDISHNAHLLIYENGDVIFEHKYRASTFLLGSLPHQPNNGGGAYRGKIEIELDVTSDLMYRYLSARVKLPIVKTGYDGCISLINPGAFTAEGILESMNVDIKSSMLGKLGIVGVTSANVVVDKVQKGPLRERSNVLFSLRKVNQFEKCLFAT